MVSNAVVIVPNKSVKKKSAKAGADNTSHVRDHITEWPPMCIFGIGRWIE
jgi:hypothetical protein